MKQDVLRASVELAQRFIVTAKAVEKRAIEDEFTFYGCAETATCKRASMDLTRMLSRLRKP